MTQKLDKVILYTDGGARGNPGPAALGFVLKAPSGEILVERGKYLGETTNNVAEYSALVEGLSTALDYTTGRIEILMDSELIVKQMTGLYKIKQPHLQVIATEVKKFLNKFESYSFQHVLREFNKEADKQVNLAIDEALNK